MSNVADLVLEQLSSGVAITKDWLNSRAENEIENDRMESQASSAINGSQKS